MINMILLNSIVYGIRLSKCATALHEQLDDQTIKPADGLQLFTCSSAGVGHLDLTTVF
jgi:hypothetical protein